MVFSSIPFLFFFLPISLFCYFIVPYRFKNWMLLLFSLLFYAWGEPIYILLMIFSSVVDYTNGRLIEKYQHQKNKKRFFMILSVIINLSLLGFFKYADFFLQNLNSWFSLQLPLFEIGLPIGISFFTFQTMSYSIDVYRGEVKAEKNFLTFMTYVSMFPQLIAGPIVRYETVAKELKYREITLAKFTSGFTRFLLGLFKKVLLANQIGFLFSLISNDLSNLSVLTSWLGLLSFALQIYFDFSGYSDMAIGMGKIFGFTYLENFNYPYISTSITDFWRRWHISLSSWFRDYVYIPLGGSRVSRIFHIRNILVVWLLTGFWHGASWNFLLWGLYFGLLLLIEKFLLKPCLERLPKWLQHTYALFFILLGWLLFAFEDLSTLWFYAKSLFGINHNAIVDTTGLFYLTNYLCLFLLGILFSMPCYPWLLKRIEACSKKKRLIYQGCLYVLFTILFFFTLASLVSDSYNPFLYFRF